MHSRAIKRQCDFKMSEIREFMFGLLNALKYLAEKRIVHRDIKLENIMLRSEDTMEPVLADFGLAEMMDSSQHLFFRCGTPGFVAPEIINMEGEKQVDPQCDIFSAGLILHILLTRRPLFEGADFKAVYESNKKLNFDLHRPAYNTLNPEALDLMRKMLVINPRQRITAVEAMHHSFFGYGGVMLPAPLQNLESNPKMSEKTTLNPDSYREISEYH